MPVQATARSKQTQALQRRVLDRWKNRLQTFAFDLTDPEMEQLFAILSMELERNAKKFAPVDQGQLRNSIRAGYQIGRERANVTLGVYGVPYAAIQEYGGIIRPKGKFLAIPSKENTDRGRWPRQYPKGDLFRPGDKKVLISKTQNKIMFYLARQSRIAGSRYLTRSLTLGYSRFLKNVFNLVQRG